MSSDTNTRYRERSVITPAQEMLIVTGIRNVTSTTNGPYTTAFEEEEMTDVVTPQFHKRIAAGDIISSTCEYEHRTGSSIGSGFGHFNHSSYEYTMEGPLTRHRLGGILPSFVCAVEPTSSSDTAKLYALSNVDTTPYAFGEDVLELGETIRFLKNPLGSLYKLSRQYRKRYLYNIKKKRKLNFNDAKFFAKAHADAWLQYRFAVSPLVRSVSDLLEAYSDKPKRQPPRLTARGFSSGGGEDSCNYTVTTGSTVRTYAQTYRVESDIKASIMYQVTNPVQDWRWKYGLRNKDLPVTLWQIVPFSFMVDRLWDVSSMINGVTALADPGVKVLTATVRHKMGVVKTIQHTKQVSPGWTINLLGEVWVDENYSYTRFGWTPELKDTVPGIVPKNLVNSATKTADLVALIISNFTKR